MKPLSQTEIRNAQLAQQAIGARRFEEAARHATPLARAHPEHVQLQMLAAQAERGCGRPADALTFIERAMTATPGDLNLRNIHANCCAEAGDSGRALQLFERLVLDAPGFRDGHINRAVTALDAGECALCVVACTQGLGSFPGDARLLAIRGAAAKNLGDIEQAITDLEDAAGKEPERPLTHYNLAVALRAGGEYERACIHYEKAARLGMATPELGCNWAAAALEAGDLEFARGLYSSVLQGAPGHEEASRALTRLVREYDGAADAFSHYRQVAEANAGDVRTWLAWLDALSSFEDFEGLADASARALQRHPDLLQAQAYRAIARGRRGETAEAIAELDAIGVQSGEIALSLPLAELLLQSGDAERAEQLLAAFLEERPLDQSAWAYRATAWRMLEEPREEWLCNYDQLVKPIELAPENGTSAEDFAAEVANLLESLHQTRFAPGDQSLRNGTQTSGALFERRHPILKRFQAAIMSAAQDWIATLRDDEQHPFLSRKSKRIAFAGSWSVKLGGGGFHVPHFHQAGWISSAYYARLPDCMDEDDGQHQGWIQFGAPPVHLGKDIVPRRLVQPQPGLMVLFPSYLWHGTLPFQSGQSRLTSAFDIVPA